MLVIMKREKSPAAIGERCASGPYLNMQVDSWMPSSYLIEACMLSLAAVSPPPLTLFDP